MAAVTYTSQRHRKGILHSRGITDAVIDGSQPRYVSFDGGARGVRTVVQHYPGGQGGLPPDWKSGIARSSGLLIRRYPLIRCERDWAPEWGEMWVHRDPLGPYLRWDPPPYFGGHKRNTYHNPPGAKG